MQILKKQILRDIEFIEIARALSPEICQATAFKSRFKNNVNKIK